ncbi:hypothetical protein Tco_1248885 [Tanacetum coccineum]
MFKDSDFRMILISGRMKEWSFVQEKEFPLILPSDIGSRLVTAGARSLRLLLSLKDIILLLTISLLMNTLIKIKEEKAKAKGVAIKDVEYSSRHIKSMKILQPLPTINLKDKGKGVLVEEEPEKPEKVKRRDQGIAQIESDAELAQRLHKEELAELDRAQKEKQKQEEATKAALAEEFYEIQARMDVDHELAVRLTHEEQEKYTIEKRAILLAGYFERRKKQLAVERAKVIRNKPPTRAQFRNRMITYLKHMDGSNTKKAGKRIKRIIDSTSKQKSPKKSKVIKEQESIESNAEAATNYEQEKEELRIADGNTSYHKTFSSMLRKFDRQDIMDLHRLVMKRFKDNTLEGYNLLLWGDLKVMFKPNTKDEIWSNQQDWTLISWKLYENCGVYSLLMDGTLTCFNILVEKRYPLIKEMLKKMLN